MEPESIDWSSIESMFEEDSTYENINAPKWVDLSAPPEPFDDESWFCNPDCKQPKTIGDFLKPIHRNFKVKFLRSVTISRNLPFRDRDRRDVKQKGTEINLSSEENHPTGGCLATKAANSSYKFNEDIENLNPNLSTPSWNVKPSMEKKKTKDDSLAHSSRQERKIGLKSTFSARNLVAGREVLSQITELCAELKKLATNGLKKGSSEKVSGGLSGELKKERVRKRERRPLLVVQERDSLKLKRSLGLS